MSNTSVHFGPRLVARPTGSLRAAALVRPPAAIENAKPMIGEPSAIYARALEQHDVLCKTLAYFGVEVSVSESAGEDPYEVAAADAAVVFEDGATIMRPSAMSRRGEADRIEAEFARIDVPIAGHIAAPGLFDGGDVLLAGKTAFVGMGPRGNTLGRNGFSSIARAHGYDVVEVRLAADVTSLRSVAGAVAHDTIVLAEGKVDTAAFAGFATLVLERGEDLAAGVLCLGERHVLADVRYRTSLRALRRAGVTVEAIDLYEFTKIGVAPGMLAIALKRD
jgi:N-dimethylarginine dimethylaminohydrolase